MHNTIVAQQLTNLDELLAKIAEQQARLRNVCACGKPGAVYADDGRTPLCGRCWWQIYGRPAHERH